MEQVLFDLLTYVALVYLDNIPVSEKSFSLQQLLNLHLVFGSL